MKTLAFLAAALAAVVTSAAAQPANPPLAPPGGPETVQAGVYAIDTHSTLVRYETMHMGYNVFWGTFPGATGTLTLDPANLAAAKLEVKVPLAGLETTDRVLNAELLSADYFDFIKHPTMTFVSTSVARTGPRTARIEGNLSMHGITRPVTLEATFIGAGPNSFSNTPTIGFHATGVVKRSDFGMAKYVPIVSDETRIFISAAFEKQK